MIGVPALIAGREAIAFSLTLRFVPCRELFQSSSELIEKSNLDQSTDHQSLVIRVEQLIGDQPAYLNKLKIMVRAFYLPSKVTLPVSANPLHSIALSS